MLYNIIGDIHGRTIWQKLYRPDAVNIFVGDYFDPYNRAELYGDDDDDDDDNDHGHPEFITVTKCIDNLSEIIQLKQANPHNVVLLLGNHDLHYFDIGEKYSRYSYSHAQRISNFLLQNMSAFNGIAYNIDNKVLVSHAGVTLKWLERHEFPIVAELTPENVALHINALFFDGYSPELHYWQGLNHFSFDACCDSWDFRGSSVGAPPVWVRPETLLANNAFADTDYVQVVGHTKMAGIQHKANVYFVDCLSQLPTNGNYSHLSLKYENGIFTI